MGATYKNQIRRSVDQPESKPTGALLTTFRDRRSLRRHANGVAISLAWLQTKANPLRKYKFAATSFRKAVCNIVFTMSQYRSFKVLKSISLLAMVLGQSSLGAGEAMAACGGFGSNLFTQGSCEPEGTGLSALFTGNYSPSIPDPQLEQDIQPEIPADDTPSFILAPPVNTVVTPVPRRAPRQPIEMPIQLPVAGAVKVSTASADRSLVLTSYNQTLSKKGHNARAKLQFQCDAMGLNVVLELPGYPMSTGGQSRKVAYSLNNRKKGKIEFSPTEDLFVVMHRSILESRKFIRQVLGSDTLEIRTEDADQTKIKATFKVPRRTLKSALFKTACRI